ncbi:hypothetical protein, partial [Escherichia coli]|uniref:hypothetical protein n=1 Tax=Escherichia coli TaxID=562 RepID=UPI0031B57AE0
QPATGETYPKSDLFNKAVFLPEAKKMSICLSFFGHSTCTGDLVPILLMRFNQQWAIICLTD